MKKIICSLLLTLGILYAQEAAPAKVVYDLTTKDLKNFEMRLLSAIVANKAHYESTFREFDVAVMIHGGAYKFFLKDPANSKYKDDKALVATSQALGKRIKTLADTYHVEFMVCGVGSRRNGLEKKDFYDFVKIIPNTAIGLTDKQNEGYAYLPLGD